MELIDGGLGHQGVQRLDLGGRLECLGDIRCDLVAVGEWHVGGGGLGLTQDHVLAQEILDGGVERHRLGKLDGTIHGHDVAPDVAGDVGEGPLGDLRSVGVQELFRVL